MTERQRELEQTPEWQVSHAVLSPIHAKRSGISYFQHVREGVLVLDAMEDLYGHNLWLVKRAFVIHPLVQRTEDLQANFDLLWQFDPTVVALAMEYRWVANLGTRRAIRDNGGIITLADIPHVNMMLIADKVQNRKDFLATYPKTDVENFNELDRYFRLWMDALKIPESDYQDLTRNMVAC